MPSFEELHLNPSIAGALQRMGWSAADPLVREAAPTTARGHNLVAVSPPVPVYATPVMAALLSRLMEQGRALLLAPESQLGEWRGLLHRLSGDKPRVHLARGTARAVRHLRSDPAAILVASPETALTLVTRSALRMESIDALVIAWPESWPDEDSLIPLMQDFPKERQRIICTADSGRVGALTERYARKAPVVGAAPEGAPAGPVRTASVSWDRRAEAISDLIELLDPASAVVWTADHSQHELIASVIASQPGVELATGDAPSTDTIIAFDLPTAGRLGQLVAAGEVVLLAPPGTEDYVSRIAAPRRPLRLSGLVEAVNRVAATQRAAIAGAIESGKAERSILTLAPLFERYDPVAVAGALFQLWTSSAPTEPAPQAEVPAISRVYVGLGKKDGVTANDLVAVLTKELHLERSKIGRIELREGYSLIEVPAQEAEKVAAGLTGRTVRRKRLTARVDRGSKRSRRFTAKPSDPRPAGAPGDNAGSGPDSFPGRRS